MTHFHGHGQRFLGPAGMVTRVWSMARPNWKNIKITGPWISVGTIFDISMMLERRNKTLWWVYS